MYGFRFDGTWSAARIRDALEERGYHAAAFVIEATQDTACPFGAAWLRDAGDGFVFHRTDGYDPATYGALYATRDRRAFKVAAAALIPLPAHVTSAKRDRSPDADEFFPPRPRRF